MTLVQPGPEMQALIRKELNENVNTAQRDLNLIKEWLAKQPHLPQFEGAYYQYMIQDCDTHIFFPLCLIPIPTASAYIR
jgi:hypothetical protein